MQGRLVRVLHVNFSDRTGGAARAVVRINNACINQGLESRVLVIEKLSKDEISFTPISIYKKYFLFILRRFSESIVRLFPRDIGQDQSISIFGSGLVSYINSSDFDIVNLHWVNGEMLSINEISQIKKPIVWTLHDMWPFCGTDHYTESDYYVNGLKRTSILNRAIYSYKMRRWKNLNVNIVGPSNWIKAAALESTLFEGNNAVTIPNPIDTRVFRFKNKKCCRKYFGFSDNVNLVLFGAISGTGQFRKGFDLLLLALNQLMLSDVSFEVVIFGGNAENSINLPFKVHDLGVISDDEILSDLYNACDIFVLPSRQDNLPNTLVESSSCGLPSIAFDIGGCKDIIEHKISGYLAEPFDIIDFSEGMRYILTNKHLFPNEFISQKAHKKFSFGNVGSRYVSLYNSLI